MATAAEPLSLRLPMIGGAYCGKSSLMKRYSDGTFDLNITTCIGPCIHTVRRQNVKIDLWDTPGIEAADFMTNFLIRPFSEAFILVYAINNAKSFERLKGWIEVIKKECTLPITDMSLVLLGNKCDLINERVVSRGSGEKLAASIDAAFFETSCKTGENIDKVLMTVIELYRKKKDKPQHVDDELEDVTLAKLGKKNVTRWKRGGSWVQRIVEKCTEVKDKAIKDRTVKTKKTTKEHRTDKQ